MKKVVFVFGTRPEAIKMAPVIKRFEKDQQNFETIVVVTAQHREMLDQVLSLFDIVPDYDLNLMSPNQTLESLTSKILIDLSALFRDLKPDLVFVQGDTSTTFSAALAAFYQQCKVAHVEAGLRTDNIYSPFPEEINRRITSSISSLHFPPTEKSRLNLINESVDANNILVCGNTVIDALNIVSYKIDEKSIYYDNYFNKNYSIDFSRSKMILVTGHRRESFGEGFENICSAIRHIANNHDIQIVYPVHLNPNVQEPVNRILGKIDNVYLISPQDYIPFIFLMKKSYIILSDSGGIQEEAPTLGKPVLVMRDTTERQEGIDAGTARLVGTDPDSIIHHVNLLLTDQNAYDKMANTVNPYGIGNSSDLIYQFVLDSLK